MPARIVNEYDVLFDAGDGDISFGRGSEDNELWNVLFIAKLKGRRELGVEADRELIDIEFPRVFIRFGSLESLAVLQEAIDEIRSSMEAGK